MQLPQLTFAPSMKSGISGLSSPSTEHKKHFCMFSFNAENAERGPTVESNLGRSSIPSTIAGGRSFTKDSHVSEQMQ